MKRIYDTRGEQLEGFAEQAQTGNISRFDFREQLTKSNERLSVQLDELDLRFPDQRAKTDPMELLRQEYLQLLKPDEAGLVNWESARDFLESLPSKVRDYIEGVSEAAATRLPDKASKLVLELKADRKQLQPYWDITSDAYDDYGVDVEAMTAAEFDAVTRMSISPIVSCFLR